MSYLSKYKTQIVGSIVCLALGMLSGYSVKSGHTWYTDLHKPSFNPPSWIFAPIWTILYIMIGIVLGKIWQNKPDNRFLLILFLSQFILNLIWSPLFFGYHRIDLALYDICLLWINLLTFMIYARKNKTIILLFVPYIIWISIALILNYFLYILN